MSARKSALAITLAAVTAGPVLAADLSGGKSIASAAYAPSSVYDWTGGYVGIHAGMARGKSTAKEINTSNDPTNTDYCNSDTAPFVCNVNGAPHLINTPMSSFNMIGDKWGTGLRGTIAGVTVGYNKQKGNIVYGVEADVGYLGVRGKSGPSPWSQDDTFLHTDASDYSTARVRVGYAFDRFLVYGTAGAAMARFNSYVDDPDIAIGIMTQRTNTQFGYALGGGVEYALFDNLTIKADFLTMGFMGQKSIGYMNVTCNNLGGVMTCPPAWKLNRAGMAAEGTAGWRISHTLNVARVGVNYKF